MDVVHVLATDGRRGAEVFAAGLVPRLERPGIRQRIAVLRPGGAERVSFGAPTQVVDGSLADALRAWRPSVVLAHGGEAFLAAARARSAAPIVYRRIGTA